MRVYYITLEGAQAELFDFDTRRHPAKVRSATCALGFQIKTVCCSAQDRKSVV